MKRYSISLLAVFFALSAAANYAHEDWAQQEEWHDHAGQHEHHWHDHAGQHQHHWHEQVGQHEQHWQDQVGQHEQNWHEPSGHHEENWHEHDGGIGVVIARGEDGMRIVEVMGNSPAAAANLQVGDYIWAIDGMLADYLCLECARDSMWGEIGSPIEIIIRRSGVESRVSMVRECSHHWNY